LSFVRLFLFVVITSIIITIHTAQHVTTRGLPVQEGIYVRLLFDQMGINGPPLGVPPHVKWSGLIDLTLTPFFATSSPEGTNSR
jgi:hypothetical protein